MGVVLRADTSQILTPGIPTSSHQRSAAHFAGAVQSLQAPALHDGSQPDKPGVDTGGENVESQPCCGRRERRLGRPFIESSNF